MNISKNDAIEAKRYLSALGYPEDIVGKTCHITVEDSNRRIETFIGVKILSCRLQKQGNCKELVIEVDQQIHRMMKFNILTRNVGPNTNGITHWWTIASAKNERRTEHWKVTGLIIPT